MAGLTEEEIQRGWELAWSFSGDRPLGTYLVSVKQVGNQKYYLLTDGYDNWYYTSSGSMRLENELKKKHREQRQKNEPVAIG